MSFFLSFLFWAFSAQADVSPAGMEAQSPTSVQRVMPASRSMPVTPHPRVRSRTGGGTVIILEDTHFKPLR